MHEMKNKHHRGEIVQDARAEPSFSRIHLFFLLVQGFSKVGSKRTRKKGGSDKQQKQRGN
jgi:hypothetical protein